MPEHRDQRRVWQGGERDCCSTLPDHLTGRGFCKQQIERMTMRPALRRNLKSSCLKKWIITLRIIQNLNNVPEASPARPRYEKWQKPPDTPQPQFSRKPGLCTFPSHNRATGRFGIVIGNN
jgi:hypothetical protein